MSETVVEKGLNVNECRVMELAAIGQAVNGAYNAGWMRGSHAGGIYALCGAAVGATVPALVFGFDSDVWAPVLGLWLAWAAMVLWARRLPKSDAVSLAYWDVETFAVLLHESWAGHQADASPEKDSEE